MYVVNSFSREMACQQQRNRCSKFCPKTTVSLVNYRSCSFCNKLSIPPRATNNGLTVTNFTMIVNNPHFSYHTHMSDQPDQYIITYIHYILVNILSGVNCSCTKLCHQVRYESRKKEKQRINI